jgi:hypothetical protein
MRAVGGPARAPELHALYVHAGVNFASCSEPKAAVTLACQLNDALMSWVTQHADWHNEPAQCACFRARMVNTTDLLACGALWAVFSNRERLAVVADETQALALCEALHRKLSVWAMGDAVDRCIETDAPASEEKVTA